MNIHEYQAKKLMSDFGIGVSKGIMVTSVDEAIKAAKAIGGDRFVVKAQIHAGGRGKAGGVKLATSFVEVEQHAKNILGMNLVTYQTGPSGKIVKKLLVEQAIDIEHEYYVAIVLDRNSGKINMLCSSEGGVEIEKVAKETPEKIIKVVIDPSIGFSPFMARKLTYGIGLKSEEAIKDAMKTFEGLYKLYTTLDCSIAEINPLVLTKQQRVIALDAKINFDDNGLFRHPEINDLRDENEESASELEASTHGLSYISLDGNIGCLVNGAGLAMATMDIIKLHGGSPANFLDVGGGATKEAVKKGCSIILSDSNVKAILINIFGGIMRCDVVAEGVTEALKESNRKVPVVVRLEGTNVALGKKIMSESGLKIISANDLEDAAMKVVTVAKEKEEEK
ncbi:MAG: ADP-forming succinate--CoA ligase subunit beta [Oligoflexia bacterium]|nr:ADP-forming succinate--CoA ligase subunit beta [Oligoflexia bacterium]